MLTKSQLSRLVADLRANADKQGFHVLHRVNKDGPDTYCCLGRVAVVLGPDVGVAPGGKTEQNCVEYEGSPHSLGYKLAELFGSIDGTTNEWPNAREVMEEIWDRNPRFPEGIKVKTGLKPLTYIYTKTLPCLMSLNDSWGWSFQEIAELLERCYPAVEDPTNSSQTPASA